MNQRQKQQLMRIDRTTGYLILIVFITVFLVFLGYGFYLIFRTKEIRYAEVSQISSLRLSDPVKFKGMDVGRVSKITKLDNKIIIQFKVTSPFVLHENYYIRTGDLGVMGDRAVLIEQGDTNLPVVDKSDTLKVEYVSGMSYLLGQAYKLPQMIEDWKEATHVLLRGTEDKTSLVSNLKIMGNELDTIVNYLHTAMISISSDDYNLMDTLNKIAEETIKITDKTKKELNKRVPQIDTALIDLIEFIDELDTVTVDLSKTVNNIKNNRFIKDDDITPIIEALNDIKAVLNDIRKDCLKLRGVLKLGF